MVVWWKTKAVYSGHRWSVVVEEEVGVFGEGLGEKKEAKMVVLCR